VIFTIKYIDYYGKIWQRNLIIKEISGPDKFKIHYHTHKGIKFSWEYINVLPPEIKGYDIYRSLNKAGPYEKCNNLLIDTIRVFEDKELYPNTYYYWYVVAVDTFGNKGVSKDTLYAFSYFPLQAGFPRKLFGEAHPLPTLVADIDYEYPGEEIIAWWKDKLYLFHGDGTDVPGYPVSVSGIALPCVCDIDHDGENEIICALRWAPKIRIYEKDGNFQEISYPDIMGSNGISIADFQKDGRYEIIVLTQAGKVYVLKEEGDTLWTSAEYGSPAYGPAIGDIDGDNYLDIVFASYDKLYAFKYNILGSPWFSLIPSFPVNLEAEAGARPLIADLNPQSEGLEIFQMAQYIGIKLYACLVNKNGEIVNKKILSSPPFNIITSGYPSIIKYKDTLQICIGWAKKPDSMLPGIVQFLIPSTDTFNISNVNFNSFCNSPIIVNLDDDPESEVLISLFHQKILGFDKSGCPLQGFPIQIGLNPAIWNACGFGDVDADGDMEIVILLDNGELFVWDTPIKKQSNYEWRYPRHDLFNTGNYHFVMPQYVHTDQKTSTAYNSQKKLLIDDDGVLHLVYHAWDSVFYAFSQNEGVSWANQVIGGGEFPSIFINDGINILWRKDKKLYFRRKIGGNWQNREVILTLPGYSNFVSVPSFITYGGYAHTFVEVENIYMGRWELWYGKFNLDDPSGTIVWRIIDKRGPPYPQSFSHPSVDVDNLGRIHLVYEINDTVFYRFKEIDWSTPEVISEGLLNKNPSISYFRNYIDVVWEKEGEIYHRKKPVTGNWWEIKNISNTPDDTSAFPVIIGSSQVLWQEKVFPPVNTNYLIRHKSFDGINWGDYQNVSPFGSYHPQVTLKPILPDSGIIYFV
ncbi:MAG: VCBS repeat-containing protein, partial [Candidatus Omnitrophica bacterium]|nr:VCBS repeat-containing protein [Candidatus Omnitrophota bacterium]